MSHVLNQSAVTAVITDLSRLELIALTLAANGIGLSETATRLSMTEDEILSAFHIAERKLEAGNRLQAISIAIRKGLIGIEV
jgi:DNA-binding CsgD family transcriptional regulator